MIYPVKNLFHLQGELSNVQHLVLGFFFKPFGVVNRTAGAIVHLWNLILIESACGWESCLIALKDTLSPAVYGICASLARNLFALAFFTVVFVFLLFLSEPCLDDIYVCCLKLISILKRKHASCVIITLNKYHDTQIRRLLWETPLQRTVAQW